MDYLNENVILNNSGSSNNSNGGNNTVTTVQSGIIKVNVSLNVRSGAGTSHSVIGSLSNEPITE